MMMMTIMLNIGTENKYKYKLGVSHCMGKPSPLREFSQISVVKIREP